MSRLASTGSLSAIVAIVYLYRYVILQKLLLELLLLELYMIVDRANGDTLRGSELHMAFSINSEGRIDNGLVAQIAREEWPEWPRCP